MYPKMNSTPWDGLDRIDKNKNERNRTMKKTNISKLLILALSVALLIGTVFAISASANTEPKIVSQNIRYQGDFAIMLAIDASTVSGGSVMVELYDENPTSTSVPVGTYSQNKVTTANGNLTVDSYIVSTKGIAAVDMTKPFYFKAIDGNNNESSVMRYSVAEYLYERLADATATTEQKNLYNAVINMGDCAQIVLSKETMTPVSDYALVTCPDGGVIDNYPQGVYPIGTEVKPLLAGGNVEKWTVVTYDDDGKSTTSSLNYGESITVSGRTEIYCGNVAVSYKAGTSTFENLNVGDNISTDFFAFANGATGSIVKDTVYSKASNVIKFTYTAKNHAIHAYGRPATETGVSAEDGSAFEFSFDMKLDSISETDNSAGRLLKVDVCHGSNVPYREYLRIKNGKLWYDNANSYGTELCSLDEYHNICYRLKVNGDTTLNLEIYVDGTKVITKENISRSQYTVTSLSQLTKAVITAESAPTEPVSIFFDNIYSGYIK